MTTANPTAPEPGQRVNVEFLAEQLGSVLILRPIAVDGTPCPDLADSLMPEDVRWHPADVPPQPPVLAEDTVVRLKDRDGAWLIGGCWKSVNTWNGASSDETLDLQLIRLDPADVPGPLDRARTAERERLDALAQQTAARRELEQLRGEVGKIADRDDAFASGSPVPETLRSFADTLRAALAATAPATPDPGPSGCPCCNGQDTGDVWRLCETCTDASLAGNFPHGCKRPADAHLRFTAPATQDGSEA